MPKVVPSKSSAILIIDCTENKLFIFFLFLDLLAQFLQSL